MTGKLRTTPDSGALPRRGGHRYEVVDGKLLVTGAQASVHHAAVVGLLVRLKQACPSELLVTVGSLDFRPVPGVSLRPDLMVCRRDEAGPQIVVRPPLLAVEVISASTRVTDVVLKRTRYEQYGVPSYWLLDPDNQELTVLHLTNHTYTCHTVVQSEELFETDSPFPLTFSPAELLS
ncbi:Uma2 family endonuclease [Kribbella voronezhensis]|uniref:Uma2 family endonuclease n=1 Tax=Kribbella voronezhensis TaxID=2512212 RepID=A0A4R7TIX7_9ACTN|nr:Uma2 family endonuclease [Kribbella voronezhensis]TDU91646.1 Uma2 family endonuclease [Kribbella voronezhensis]